MAYGAVRLKHVKIVSILSSALKAEKSRRNFLMCKIESPSISYAEQIKSQNLNLLLFIMVVSHMNISSNDERSRFEVFFILVVCLNVTSST